MKRLSLVALALIAACGTPQEQCIARNTRELRTIDQLIARTEGNLKRGYALEEVTVWTREWVYCAPPPPPPPPTDGTPPPPPQKPRLCLDNVPRTVTRPKSIDLAAEARKLRQLQDKRRDLARAAEAVIAQCRVEYPE